MNLNCFASKWLYRFENHYQKENMAKSKYLIIKRESGSSPLGLFAYYITNAAWIEYAVRKGFTPVIDMQNFRNTYHGEGELGKINTYEYFFKQPCGVSVEEALRSGEARYVWKDIPDFHPNESLDFLEYEEIVNYYRQIVKTYMPFQEEVKKYLDEKADAVLGNEKRVVGVLARGTDYTGLKPYFHPVQPTAEEIIQKLDNYIEKYDCGKIYIATEDETILKRMKERYGNSLCWNEQKRMKSTDTFLNYNKEFIKEEPYKRGLDYLASVYLLSKCTGLVAGRTSGTVGAVLMADRYEFQYIFSEGRYGVEENILNHRVL